MALRTIYLEDDEVLRKISKPITEFNQKLWDLLDDMAQTMYHAEGVGLAAVQVGILRQVVVIDVGDGLIELINPKIVSEKGEQTDLEGCLSCPRQYGRVTRPAKVKVSAQDRNGNGAWDAAGDWREACPWGTGRGDPASGGRDRCW